MSELLRAGGLPLTQTPTSVSSRDLLVTGEACLDRSSVSQQASVASGSLYLTYWTARKSETVTNISFICGTTAAGATPTLVRYGLYTVASNGDLTLVASTVNDTAIFSVASTEYSKAVSVPYLRQLGVRYATGLLVVTGAALPQPICAAGTAAQGIPYFKDLRKGATLTGQTDLPGSVLNASLIAPTRVYYSEVT